LDTPREVTVRQRAILGRNGKLHLFDVVLGKDFERSIILKVGVRNGYEACSFLPAQLVCSTALWREIQKPQHVSNQYAADAELFAHELVF
jgi:hypothetical protein